MTRLGVFVGSLRAGSLSRAAAAAAIDLMPEGVSAGLLPSIGALPHYDQDLFDAGLPASVAELAAAAAEKDAFLVVTPEYNWSIPGVLKNAIDWLSRLSPNPLEGKPVSIWTVSPGLIGGARAHESLRHVLHSQGMHIMAKPEVQIAGAKAKIDVAAGRVLHGDTETFLSEQLRRFGAFCAR